jgi:hypothetical protein
MSFHFMYDGGGLDYLRASSDDQTYLEHDMISPVLRSVRC